MAMYYGKRVAPKGDERVVAKSLLSGVAIAIVILLLSAVNARANDKMDPGCKDLTIKDLYEYAYLGKEKSDHIMSCINDYSQFRVMQAKEAGDQFKAITAGSEDPLIFKTRNAQNSQLLPLVQAHGMEAQAVYLEMAVNQLSSQLVVIRDELNWVHKQIEMQKVKGLVRDLGDNAKVMDHLDLLDGVE